MPHKRWAVCPCFLQSVAAAGQYLIYCYIRWEFAARFCCSKPSVPAASPAEIRWRYQHRPGAPTGARGGRPGLPGAGEQGRAGTAGPCPGARPSLAWPQPPVGPLCSACSVLTDCSTDRPPFSHLIPCVELSSECQRAHGTQDSPGAAPPPSLPRGRAAQMASETRGRRRSPEGRRRPGALGGRSCLGNPVERVRA